MRIKLIIRSFTSVAVFSFCIFQTVFAQQDPMYTNYMFNKLVFNPAFTGSNPEYISVTFLYHNQWLGFGGDDEFQGIAPQTQTFSIHSPIPNVNFIGGAGLYIISDKHGFEERTTADITLSFKKYFSFGTFQLGVNAGGVQSFVDGNWKPPDPTLPDPDIPPSGATDMKPDLGAGIYFFTTNRFYFGISSQHLLGGNFSYGGATNELVRQSYFTAGYNWILASNPDLEIQPSILYKIDKAKKQLDLNVNAFYKNKFYGGISLRQGNPTSNISVLMGMRISPKLTFGYSYDLTTNKIGNYSSGSHEVVINYIFKIKTRERIEIPNIIWTPRYLRP